MKKSCSMTEKMKKMPVKGKTEKEMKEKVSMKVIEKSKAKPIAKVKK